jgi:hypothetical protein
VLLLTVLVVSTFGLVPGQSPRVLGAEVLGFGLLPWLILIGIHVDAVRGHAGPSRGFLVRRIVLAQGAVLPLLIAGVSLLLLTGGGSTGWSPALCCAWLWRCWMRGCC